jgi:hypothetical protein
MLVRVKRPVDLFSLVARQNRRTESGHHAGLFPTCGRCRTTAYDDGGLPVQRRKYVDEVQLVEWGGDHARVLGKCHGQEHTITVRFPKAMTLDDEHDLSLWRAMWRGLVFFDTELER